jgi:hypothetical protein
LLVVPDLLCLPIVIRVVTLHFSLRPLVREAEFPEHVMHVGAAHLDRIQKRMFTYLYKLYYK